MNINEKIDPFKEKDFLLIYNVIGSLSTKSSFGDFTYLVKSKDTNLDR